MFDSSSSFSSLLPPHFSSNSSIHDVMDDCFRTTLSITVFIASSLTILLLLLPLFILVLCLGVHLWRRQSSSLHNADLFLHHSIIMSIDSFLGFIIFFCGGYVYHGLMMWVGLYIWTVSSAGQAVLHLLMCVERYLAVLRPISYLELKQTAGARIRTLSISCVWVLCVGWAAVVFLSSKQVYLILDYIITAGNVLIISFCSVSVLFVLKRPGPGLGDRADRTKRRAFYTIVVVMGTLAVRFSWNMMNSLMVSLGVLDPNELCVVLMSDVWFELPSNLVLPLMFLVLKTNNRPKSTSETLRTMTHHKAIS